MTVVESIAALCSPFPLVNIAAPGPPEPGLHHPVPKICRKVFGRGECESFYRSLADTEGWHQCPYGFSVWPVQLGDSRFAITALVASPRLGGDAERLRGKEYPESRVAASAVEGWAEGVRKAVSQGDVERDKEFARRLEALHEIRRLNGIVRTNMERACTAESPKDPDAAQPELVRAHRASSLISVQLDALDLLANPASAMSFAPRRWVFYKTVDKIVRLYQVLADDRNVKIRMSGSSRSEALLDERTIHIIPSVFIDNAVKYSHGGGVVDVHVCDELSENRGIITLEVRSLGPAATEEEERNLFAGRGRGKAARAVAEGSGLGLTLAKVVSDQHGGRICAAQRRVAPNRSEWAFTFSLPAA